MQMLQALRSSSGASSGRDRSTTSSPIRPFSAILALGLLLLALSQVHAGTVTYTYDAIGRLVGMDDGAGGTKEFTYDVAGNILKVLSVSPDNTLRVILSPAGNGSVAADGISCPGQCSHQYEGATELSLTPTGASGYRFIGWGGAATGNANPLSLNLSQDMDVIAYFSAENDQTDSDGVPDSSEMGPSGDDMLYDGNADGIPDYQQANAASMPTDTVGYATLSVPLGLTLANVAAVPNPSPGDTPAGVQFPLGFFSFSVTGLSSGGCSTVTLDLPLTSTLNSYMNYGPTSDDADPHWYVFTKSGTTGAQISHMTSASRITLDLCDGERGDDDLSQDGQAAALGGPTQPVFYTVSTQPGSNGAITPASRSVAHGLTTTFTITPDSGYKIASVVGCGGSLSGGTYTTGAITGDCSIEAEFTLKIGSLRMTMSPAEAVAAGAKWRRTGSSAWLDNNATESNLPAANYIVEFKEITGWCKPGDMTMTVVDSQTATGTGVYSDAKTLCKALDNCRLHWTLGGAGVWYGQNDEFVFGGSAARSGSITHSQETWIETTVKGPGTLTYLWKVSSESGWDFLEFWLDGSKKKQISGLVDWVQSMQELGEGEHTIRWRYVKDSSVSGNSDCGWLDKVYWSGFSNGQPGVLNLLLEY